MAGESLRDEKSFRRKCCRFFLAASEESIRRQSPYRRTGCHAMPSKTCHPKQACDSRIPADDKAPIRRKGAKTRPLFADGNIGKPGNIALDLFREDLLHPCIDRGVSGRQLRLIAGAEKQTLTFRAKIDVMAHVPDERPICVHPIKRWRDEEMPAAGMERKPGGSGHFCHYVRPGATGVNHYLGADNFGIDNNFETAPCRRMNRAYGSAIMAPRAFSCRRFEIT